MYRSVLVLDALLWGAVPPLHVLLPTIACGMSGFRGCQEDRAVAQSAGVEGAKRTGRWHRAQAASGPDACTRFCTKSWKRIKSHQLCTFALVQSHLPDSIVWAGLGHEAIQSTQRQGDSRDQQQTTGSCQEGGGDNAPPPPPTTDYQIPITKFSGPKMGFESGSGGPGFPNIDNPTMS